MRNNGCDAFMSPRAGRFAAENESATMKQAVAAIMTRTNGTEDCVISAEAMTAQELRSRW